MFDNALTSIHDRMPVCEPEGRFTIRRVADVKDFVNLDAMIIREDLDVTDNDPQTTSGIGTEIKLIELEGNSTTFNILRKPDFQRETSNWDPARIVGMVESFLDGDLVPSVIIWRSTRSGKLFVIDGAHRLSALIAWINDDYGDEQLSRKLFDSNTDARQKKVAKKTRDLISDRVGSYSRLKEYGKNPEGAPNDRALLRARNMGAFSIKLENVIGDVAKAERSFLKINQNATPIHEAELMIIQSRRKPNAIATRALIRAGTGHEYWSAFPPEIRQNVVELAKEIHEALFRPILQSSVRSLDLPVAGHALSPDSLDIVFAMVNHINGIFDVSTKRDDNIKWRQRFSDGRADIDLPDDTDGFLTLKLMTSVRNATSKVFGPAKGSLGLHPGVYCYGATGRFQPTAFFAPLDFVGGLNLHKQFDKFTTVRARFENFLLEYRYFINQIVGAYGSQLKGLPALLKLYRIIMDHAEKDNQKIIKQITEDEELSFIREPTDDDRKYGRNFTRETGNAIYLRKAMSSEITCDICHARLHSKAITLDHMERKADGGVGSPKNGQLAHPYCNHGYKESLAHEQNS